MEKTKTWSCRENSQAEGANTITSISGALKTFGAGGGEEGGGGAGGRPRPTQGPDQDQPPGKRHQRSMSLRPRRLKARKTSNTPSPQAPLSKCSRLPSRSNLRKTCPLQESTPPTSRPRVRRLRKPAIVVELHTRHQNHRPRVQSISNDRTDAGRAVGSAYQTGKARVSAQRPRT